LFPEQHVLPIQYYGFQFGYSQISPAPQETLQVVYVESLDKIRVLVPSNKVNHVISWMSSISTGEGLYKELSAITVGVTLISVKNYFTFLPVPPKG
jgi:hypothetical protein